MSPDSAHGPWHSLHVLVEHNADGMVVVDEHGIIRYANPAAARLFDVEPDTLPGRPIGWPLVAGVSTEMDIPRLHGEPRIAEMRVVDIDWDGRPCRLATLRDVTDEIRRENELRAKDEQLRHSQKLEAIGRIAAEVAHEINNLLMGVSGGCAAIRADLEEGKPVQPILVELEHLAARGVGITRQLLGFSRRRPVRIERVDANAIVEGIAALLRRTLGPRVDLVLRLEPTEPVRIDASQLEQVLFNLVHNARDAMPGGGTVTIETRVIDLPDYRSARRVLPAGRYVVISVADTGVGIDAGTTSKVFEPFFTTKPEGQGTGLGLASALAIIEGLRGALDFRSTPGLGSEFRILLPVAAATISDGAPAVAQPSPARPNQGLRILVVDDNAPARIAIRQLLAALGHDVVDAPDGERALEIVQQRAAELDVLLSDEILPRAFGHEVAAVARQLNPKIFVILMSGHGREAMVARGVDISAYAILDKPVDFDELESLIGAPRAAAPAAPVAERRGRVLLVDGDPMMLAALVRPLKQRFDVSAEGDGAAALARLTNGDAFDVVVCDLRAPGAMELYATLKRAAPAVAANTIFMTDGLPSPAARGFLAGVANARLEKPFEVDALMELIGQKLP